MNKEALEAEATRISRDLPVETCPEICKDVVKPSRTSAASLPAFVCKLPSPPTGKTVSLDDGIWLH